jgi:hypothetical protein
MRKAANWAMVLLTAVSLATFKPATPPSTEICPNILTATAEMEGQNYAVKCSNDRTLTVTSRTGRSPSPGKARTTGGVSPELIDSRGEHFGIIRL